MGAKVSTQAVFQFSKTNFLRLNVCVCEKKKKGIFHFFCEFWTEEFVCCTILLVA